MRLARRHWALRRAVAQLTHSGSTNSRVVTGPEHSSRNAIAARLFRDAALFNDTVAHLSPKESARGCLGAVIVSVMFTSFLGVVSRMNEMSMRQVGVVTGLLVVAGFVALGRTPVVDCGAIEMFGGFAVVLRGFFRHRRCTLRSKIQAKCDARITSR